LWDSALSFRPKTWILLSFQFSLWDSLLRSLLTMWSVALLSILFVRFKALCPIKPIPCGHFQFSLWDSYVHTSVDTRGLDAFNSLCEIPGREWFYKPLPKVLSILFVRFFTKTSLSTARLCILSILFVRFL